MKNRMLDVLDILVRAANNGDPCPTNIDICVELGLESVGNPPKYLRQLEAAEVIRVERYQIARRVTIVSTGKSTRAPRFTTPHWRAA